MKSVQRQSGQQAFTLIEMILAIGIASIVLITITTVLFSTLRLRQATEDMVDAASPIDLAAGYIKRDLECVMTPTNGTSKIMSGCFRIGNLSSGGVSGTVLAEMYTATGALSTKAPWGDVQRVTYELRDSTPAGRGQDLYRSVMRNLLAVATPEVTDQLMLSGISSVKFYGYDGSQWDDTWDTSDVTSLYTNLPVAVKVEIHLAGMPEGNSDPITLVVPIDQVARTNATVSYPAGAATTGGGGTTTGGGGAGGGGGGAAGGAGRGGGGGGAGRGGG